MEVNSPGSAKPDMNDPDEFNCIQLNSQGFDDSEEEVTEESDCLEVTYYGSGDSEAKSAILVNFDVDGSDECDCMRVSCPGCFFPCPNDFGMQHGQFLSKSKRTTYKGFHH